ncbi:MULTISPECIES: CHAT domain-containing protein [Okeania]|uniref:CHAT domain-containing protein n=1 Tax=Okeania TaxID=1458928 RepID=UPI001F00C906|nr:MULTISPECIES: CHAT domain-containing protein [Okeania]
MTIFIFILSLIIILTFNSEKTVSQDINLTVSEKVMKMEERLKKEFEAYFDRDFSKVSKTGDDIAKKLLEISQTSNIKPAVFWAIPEPEYLHLVFIYPGKKPLVKDLDFIKYETLIQAVKLFQNEITNPQLLFADFYLNQAQQLYEWIIKPFAANLQAEKIDTILFCLGKGLRTLPIAALHDGKKFLVEKYSLAIIPAFNLIDSNYTPIQKARILAMGASEFQTQKSLPAVPVELSTIVDENLTESISPQNISQGWPGKLFLNQEFTLENLKNQLSSQFFNIIHLATHAKFQPGKPENSYIQFWDTQLHLDKVKEIAWNTPPAELLVLSACKTAVGDRDVELGFAGLALEAGVQSVLASLWYVNDIGTLALMSEFYEQLKTAPSKAEAIRQTQIKMIQGDVLLRNERLKFSRGEISLPESLQGLGEINFSHPFYWSGFTLVSSPW